MATNVDIEGLASDWESSSSVRSFVRTNHLLFPEELDGRRLDVNISGAEKCVDILIPLLKKLVDPETLEVGMCSIPALETEWLVFCEEYVFPVFLLRVEEWQKQVQNRSHLPQASSIPVWVVIFISRLIQ